MTITLNIDPSWTTIPHALARILTSLAALERPREPGEDLDDLSELLAGMDDPEPAAPARPAPQPAPTPPAPRRFDGPPTSGQSLYKYACQAKVLPKINAIGKARGFPKLVTHWTEEQVAEAYAMLTEPAAQGNGRAAP
jgi:hypothetical protein